jgi:hypothetical protein
LSPRSRRSSRSSSSSGWHEPWKRTVSKEKGADRPPSEFARS